MKRHIGFAARFCGLRSALMLAAVLSCGVFASMAQAAGKAQQKIEDRVVSRGDVRIETLAQGRGPVVVLLASLGRGAEDFDGIAADLAAQGFRVLRPEPRGIGRSAGPMTGASLHDLAADVAAAVEADPVGKHGRIIVAGHAYGSFVARALAMDRPDLVRAVVVISGGTGKSNKTGANGAAPDPERLKIRQAIVDSGNDRLSDDARLKALQYAFFAPGNDPHVWLKGWHSDVLAAQLAATEATPLEAYYSGGDKPVLDIHAQEDAVSAAADAQKFKKLFGDRVTVVMIPHAGHALVVEQPAAIGEAIVRFAR
ncbi:MAG TPA: alpha/beta hydrolase, partial [Herbaspirillum sp.]